MLRLSIILTLSLIITACTLPRPISVPPTTSSTNLAAQLTINPTETISTPSISPTVTTPPSTPQSSANPQTSLEISAPSTIKAGDVITITGRLRGMGIPQYTLSINEAAFVVVGYDGEVTSKNLDDFGLELVSASGSMATVQFVLQTTQPGPIEARISASGEVAVDQGDGQMVWSWGSATSEVLTLTITEQ